MKKIYQTIRWKRYCKKRSDAQLRKVRRKRIRVKALRHSTEGAPQVKHLPENTYQTVVAPQSFSFINNPVDVLEFLNKLHRHFQAKNSVQIDLRNITSLTCDGIAILVASLKDTRFTNGQKFVGMAPTNRQALAVLMESGFYKHFKSGVPNDATEHGSIFRRKGKKVELTVISGIVEFATKALYGKRRKCGGIWRVLIESMANTKDHASSTPMLTESWWATVYHDQKNDKVCFSFVDRGVGIFRSIKMMELSDMLKSLFGLHTNCDILKEISIGNLGSRTKIAYRGKGLPAIYKAFERQQISNLVIISNNAFAEFGNDKFRTLSRPFMGTFLYWELKK